jgi:ABC-type lipoprotein release transport system permease subunit
LLYGVEPDDPWTLGAVALLLTAIALLACHAPLRRMRGVDPAQVLRGE